MLSAENILHLALVSGVGSIVPFVMEEVKLDSMMGETKKVLPHLNISNKYRRITKEKQ